MPSCKTCNNRYFATTEALRQHILSSRTKHAYCKLCDRCFVDADALNNHRRSSLQHIERFPFCSQCNREFVDSDALQQHINSSPAHRSSRGGGKRRRNRSGGSGSSYSTPTSSVYGGSFPYPFSASPYAYPETPSSVTATGLDVSSPIPVSPVAPQQLHLHIPPTTSPKAFGVIERGLNEELGEEQESESWRRTITLRDVVLPTDISTPVSPPTNTAPSQGISLNDAVLPTDISTPVYPPDISTSRTASNSSPTPTSATSATLVTHFNSAPEEQSREQPQVRLLVNGKDVVLQSDISTPTVQWGVEDGDQEGTVEVNEDVMEGETTQDIEEEEISDSQITVRPSRIPTMHSPDPSPAPSSRATPCHSPPAVHRHVHTPPPHDHSSHLPSHDLSEPSSNVTSPDMRFEELHGLPRFSGGTVGGDDDDDTSPLAAQFEQDLRRYSTPLLEAGELGSEHGHDDVNMVSGDEREQEQEALEEEVDEEYEHERDDEEESHEREALIYGESPPSMLPFLSQDPYLLSDISPPYTPPLARRRPSSVHASAQSSHINRNTRIVDEQAYSFEDPAPNYSEPRTVSFFSRFAPPEPEPESDFHSASDRDRGNDHDRRYEDEEDDDEDDLTLDVPFSPRQRGSFIASGIQVGPGRHGSNGDSESSTPMLLTVSPTPSFFRYPFPFQLSLPPIPEREYDHDHEEDGGASIHTLNSDDEVEMGVRDGLNDGEGSVSDSAIGDVGDVEDGEGQDEGESPVTELVLPSPPRVRAEMSEEGEDGSDEERESVACPSAPNLSPLQSPRLDQLARAICNELDDVDELNLGVGLDVNDEMDIMRINIDDAIDYYDDHVVEDEGDPFTDLARVSLSVLSDTEGSYGYGYGYSDSPVESNDETKANVTCAAAGLANNASSSPTDEFFSARDSFVDAAPIADTDGNVDSGQVDALVVERVSETLSQLQQAEDIVSARLSRPESWINYPDRLPSKRSPRRDSSSHPPSDKDEGSGRSSPSVRVTRSVPAAGIQQHSRSNSSRSISPKAFLVSLGMCRDSSSGRTTPAVAADNAVRDHDDYQMQDFLDLESRSVSPHLLPLPLDSESEDEGGTNGKEYQHGHIREIHERQLVDSGEGAKAESCSPGTSVSNAVGLRPTHHTEPPCTPRIHIDSTIHRDHSLGQDKASSMKYVLNVVSPAQASPCSPYVQQTPISIRSSALQDYSGSSTLGDIPSEEESLTWVSARKLRDACLKRMNYADRQGHRRGENVEGTGEDGSDRIGKTSDSETYDDALLHERDPTEMEDTPPWDDENTGDLPTDEHIRVSTCVPPEIISPPIRERVDSLNIPATAADVDFLGDEPSIITNVCASPLATVLEVSPEEVIEIGSEEGDQSMLPTVNDSRGGSAEARHKNSPSDQCIVPLPSPRVVPSDIPSPQTSTVPDTTPGSPQTGRESAQSHMSVADTSSVPEAAPEAVPEAVPEAEEFLPGPRQATSVMHCRLCRADPCIETTATFCGHIFCYECITREVIATSKCPACRTPTLLYCLFKLDLSC